MSERWVNATELAAILGVSPARVSQYLSRGQLDGCFTGTGRNRRFEVASVAQALAGRLDPSQMLTNGRRTRAALDELAAQAGQATGDTQASEPQTIRTSSPGAGATELPLTDAARYDLARMQKMEEEARFLKRRNAEAEGRFILASEVSAQTAKQMALEIAEIEAWIRVAARTVADRFGADYRTVRQELMQAWREHRTRRSAALEFLAEDVQMSAAETAADV